jgi:phosphoribosylaminoimidazole-succinocarboxamide synthase
VVCFDWRHPLVDEDGDRLADEPLSDDYATVWMDDVPFAKEMAREVFCWLEHIFASAGLLLVDMCLFVDRSGHVIYGEISPDCMRIRIGLGAPESAQPLDKDVWRAGAGAEQVQERYQRVYELLQTVGGPHADHRQEQALEDVARRSR